MKKYILFFAFIGLNLQAQKAVEIFPRAFYNAKFEPQNGVLHGAGQDLDGFNDYTKSLGENHTPAIYMTYVSITKGVARVQDWASKLKIATQQLPKGTMLQIGLAFTGGNDTGKGLDTQVAEGKNDKELEAFYQALKDLNRPSFTRIGFEFEGKWNGYSPESYKKVFITISKAFKEKNINSATVWCSGGGSADFMKPKKLMEFYPGDEYVDWWGIDVFGAEEFTNPGLKAFFDLAQTHKKPVMIGESTPREVGALDGEKSWNKWYKPYFNMIYANPGIKAFCYINWDWVYWSNKLGFQWHHWGDARIEKNESVLKAYKKEIAKPVFIHAKTE
jgi:Glycosyl hydrolase family 26